MDRVKSLSNILRDIDDVLSQRELTSWQTTELYDVIGGCRAVLAELGGTLGKKNLKWEPEDLTELQSRIIANITVLNAFHRGLTITKVGLDQLHDLQDDRERHQEYQVILNWLSTIDYGKFQIDVNSRCQEGTGRWLLDSDEFGKWLTETKQTLFCPGIPGAGKTAITSIVVDSLHSKFRNDNSISIAYLYCRFKQPQEGTPEELLLSLLKQLIQDRPSVPESVKNLYECHKSTRTRLSLDEISEALHSVIIGYSRTFIIIDALDECQVSNEGRTRLLSKIFNLQANTGLNLFVTSRSIPEIMQEFKGSISLEVYASDEDVKRYLDGRIWKLRLSSRLSPHLREKIKTQITKAANGMYVPSYDIIVDQAI